MSVSQKLAALKKAIEDSKETLDSVLDDYNITSLPDELAEMADTIDHALGDLTGELEVRNIIKKAEDKTN